MLTHGNLASNVNLSTGPFKFSERDSCISFLPLSHVTARHLDYAMLCNHARLAYCPKFDLLAAAMKVVKPTVFVAVPRVYEKIRQAVEGKSAASAVKSKILSWAIATGKSNRAHTLEGRRRADWAGRWRISWCTRRFARRLAGARRCLSRAELRWGWIRRGGSRMRGFGSSRGMG